jgi:hypothetical protein
MSGDEEKNNPTPEDLEKRFEEMWNKKMTVFSKTIIDRLDAFNKDQTKEIDAKLETSTKAIVDYLMPQFENRTKEIVAANFDAFGKELQSRQKQVATAPVAVQDEQLTEVATNVRPQNLRNVIADGLGHILQTATLADINKTIELVILRGSNPQAEAAGTMATWLKGFTSGIKTKTGPITPDLLGEAIEQATGVKVEIPIIGTPPAK